ncbi:hydroxyacylglutathione hydrolase [Microbulbifer pacificus]|uniref:hydroxyacylglutathione hydrolase n=1 Tax=Microbulbifer pacificus TaxID=407164 RepID=UPI0018F87D02|nr:hydroxyacylglutathione hydrolase [Microbulbifer pacificus]
MITIHPIPAFNDNYIWHLRQGDEHWVVDPGDANPVFDALGDNRLSGILLTHHHPDHTGGVEALMNAYQCPVYGPATIAQVTHPLVDGDHPTLIGCHWDVLAVPGHTLDHIALVLHAGEELHLFCGDTLFAAGCGRLFEGSPEQMFDSLSRLARLPADTRVYCAHEYTEANLKFARAAEPGNSAIASRLVSVKQVRAENRPTLPSTIGLECATNPFLRTQSPTIRALACERGAPADASPVEIFTVLRRWKDTF